MLTTVTNNVIFENKAGVTIAGVAAYCVDTVTCSVRRQSGTFIDVYTCRSDVINRTPVSQLYTQHSNHRAHSDDALWGFMPSLVNSSVRQVGNAL